MKSYILIGLLYFSTSLQLWASDLYHNENEPERYIKLTHNRSGDTVILKKGDALSIMFMNKRFHGKIESVGQHSFVIKGKEFDFELLDYINIRISDKRLKTLKYVLIGVDACEVISAGLCLWGYKHFSESQDYDREFEFWKALTVLKGLLIISAIFTALAFIFLLGGILQHYDLRKKWRIESVNKN